MATAPEDRAARNRRWIRWLDWAAMAALVAVVLYRFVVPHAGAPVTPHQVVMDPHARPQFVDLSSTR